MQIFVRRRYTALLSLGVCLYFLSTAYAAADQAGEILVDHLIEEGHYLRAEALVRAAVQRNPNDAHALSNLSIVDWAFNRLDASINDAEKAVAASPNSAEAHSKLADALGAKLVSSDAGTMAKISLAHRFRKEIDRTLELDPNDADALQGLAQFYWHAPGMLGGDKSKARQTADRLYQVSPYRGASAKVDFVSEEADLNQRNAAIQAIWRNAVTTKPESYEIHAALAASYLEETGDTNHLALAESEAKRALTLDLTRVSAHTTLAIVYARSGRWAELESSLKRAQEHVPEDRAPGYRAAVAILTTNQNQQLKLAEQVLREYLSQPREGQEPSHAGAHWRLGQVLERQGRKAEAVREIQMAVQQDGSLEAAKRDLKRLS